MFHFARTKPPDHAGFLLAPLLYMLALGGIGAAVMFSGYSQILRSNAEMTTINAVRQQLSSAAQTLSASAVLDSATSTIVQPPASFDLAAVTDTARLPTGASTANATGSPTSFGAISIASGVRQLDPWGKYYIYCRWENPTATPAAPSIMVITSGPDGTLATKCGDTAAQGDDRVNKLTVAETINRANVWQVNSANQVKFGMAIDAVKVNDDGSMQAGSLTLSTPLALSSGGTGATSASGARSALSVPDFSGAGAMGLWGINVSGNAATSTRLSVPRNISVAGTSGLTASDIPFDGTSDVALSLAGTLALANGGTGATTAAVARTNLGATATGDALFTAASVTLARTALGSSSIGDALFTAASAAAARTTLGLGTMAIQNADAVAITGGTITGVTFTGNVSGTAASVDAAGVTGCCVAISAGGSGQSSAAAALTALGGDNASNLTTGTLAAGRLPLISPTSAGTYNWGTVDSAGRVTAANNLAASNVLQQGNSGVAVADTGSNGTVTVTTEGVARLVIDQAGASTFSGPVSASAPTASSHLTTKAYVDAAVAASGGGGGGGALALYDKDNTKVGPILSGNNNAIWYLPLPLTLTTTPELYVTSVQKTYVYFSSGNCTGTPSMYPAPSDNSYKYYGYACTGGTPCRASLVVPRLIAATSTNYYSYRSSEGTCYDYSSSGPYTSNLVPAISAVNRLPVTVTTDESEQMTSVFYDSYYCTGTPRMNASYVHGYACPGTYGSYNTCTTNKSKPATYNAGTYYSCSYRTNYSDAYIAQNPWAAAYNGKCYDLGGCNNYSANWTVQPAGADDEFVVTGFCGPTTNFQCKIQ